MGLLFYVRAEGTEAAPLEVAANLAAVKKRSNSTGKT